MPVEVPNFIQAIKPVYIAIPLAPYTTKGELFPDHERSRQFTVDIWKQWCNVPTIDHDTPPHILVLDFTDVKILKPERACDALAFVLGNSRGRVRPTYAYLDHVDKDHSEPLNPWLSLDSLVGKSHQVIVAREKERKEFDLIGNPTKRLNYSDALAKLAEIDGWVDGLHFARTQLNLPGPRGLEKMHRDRVILMISSTGHSRYYRSMVRG